MCVLVSPTAAVASAYQNIAHYICSVAARAFGTTGLVLDIIGVSGRLYESIIGQCGHLECRVDRSVGVDAHR